MGVCDGSLLCGVALCVLFMPPTLKKLKGHIALGLFVCQFVCPLQKLSYSFEISSIDLS